MKLFRHYFSTLLILLISCNCFAGSPTSLTSISLAPNPQQDFCAGSDILVQFSVNEAANAGNVFTVQLSDATGSFANPVTIGSIASVTSSSFNATIPLSTGPGTGYHIRVVSSSPVVISNDGPELSIYGLPSVTIEGFGSPVGPPGGFCAGVGIFLTANVVGTVASYQWKLNGSDISGATQSTYHGTVGGDYTVAVTNSNGCSVESDIFLAFELSNPQGEITGNSILCPGGTVLLNANTITGTWYLNGGEIPDNFSSLLMATTPGDYQWLPHTVSGCSGTISPVFTVTELTTSFTGLASSYSNLAAPGTLVGNPTGGTFSGPGISGNSFDPAAAGVGGPYTITYTYTSLPTPQNPLGCTVTSSQPTTVTSGCIAPLATITPTGPTTFCVGGTVLFNANTGTGLSYQWQVDGANIVGSVGSSFVSTASGSFTVVVTNADGCSATSSPVIVTVNPSPVATITPAGPATFCGNNSVTLNANTGTGFSYQWQIGTVNITGATASSFVASLSGSYRVLITNSSGCPDTSSAIIVTSNPLPSVSFTGLANIYAAVAPASTLTGNPAGGTFSGPGILGNTFDPAIAGVGGPYTITYTYTNANGCTNTTIQQTNVGSVCPVPNLPGSISSTDDGTSVCPGDVRTYTILPTPGAISYTWTAPPGANITGGQGSVTATVTYDAGFTTGDSLRVTANNSCGSSIPRARKINRKAAPASPVAISGPVTGICNMTVILYSVIQQAGDTYNWSWNTGAVSIVSGQGTNEVASDFTTSFITGKISVTASNTCGTSTPRNLIVNAKPDAPGTISGLAAVCANQQGVTYSISPVTNAASYIWYAPTGAHINDGTTTSTGTTLATTATNVQVNFSTTGGLVRVKAVNACTVSSVVSLPVSIVCKNGLPVTEIATKSVGDVYPNPSNGLFRITVPAISKIATAKIEIVNQFGQIVYQGNQQCSNGMINLNLTGKFANGIYMISCIVDGQKTVTRLMISK
ncbi:MAG: T9SS type A sorting domain-containing protein [Ferruginibacter sp.]